MTGPALCLCFALALLLLHREHWPDAKHKGAL